MSLRDAVIERVLPRSVWPVIAVSLACAAIAGAAGAHTSAHRARSRCLVPGTGQPLYKLWRPNMPAAARYAQSRTGDIAFGVRTDQRIFAYRPNHQEWSASVVKAMLLVTYLDEPWVAHRNLNSGDTSVLGPMITQSNNDDAQQVFDEVGQSGLQALANRVGMDNFATSPVWGETEITVRDQTKFFLHIDRYTAPRHRWYVGYLLSHITPSQRWGIGEVSPKGWKLYFKGGWGYGTGLMDHQVALLVRGCTRVSVAVLTMYDGSHPYGKATLRGMFVRLLRGLSIQALERKAASLRRSAKKRG